MMKNILYNLQIDCTFDILNSKSKFGKWWKEALKPSNLEDMKSVYEELKEYLLSLEDHKQQPLHTSRRKTFVLVP